ncbi:MAG: hypothetical protein J5977_04245 [Fibrobacter sp.]|uniref:hypothetical protein n=2 Tax=Fibrobacter TaxID=832 RepID=UPI00111520D1|nr:hypothetical protein [Fibrobacter sp. UWB11]MBO5531652.1 hypothetical protein [Fibrobacter sp.]
MATLFARTFTYHEMSKPTLDSFGNMVEGTFTTRTVRGTIQPVTGEEAIAYQEGGRNTGVVKIYSSERLAARTQEGTEAIGYVNQGGFWYEITDELVFGNLPKITHWKYIACKVPAAQVPKGLQ